MLITGQLAPDFSASVLMPSGEIKENFIFSEFVKNKPVFLIFYPLDFTFVCPSELIALNARLNEFKQRDVVVLAISIDSVYTHLAFSKTPINHGGLGGINYPLISDLSQDICRMYGVQRFEEAIALRASVLIDRERIVRHFSVNDLFLGRNFDEPLRLFDALAHHEKYGEVCPAQWSLGKKAMHPSTLGVQSYLNEHLNDLK